MQLKCPASTCTSVFMTMLTVNNEPGEINTEGTVDLLSITINQLISKKQKTPQKISKIKSVQMFQCFLFLVSL